MKQITNEEINELNHHIKSGNIEVTNAHGIWGVRGYKTKDNTLEVKNTHGRFFGGGISDEFYTTIKDGKELFTTSDSLKAHKWFYDELKAKLTKKVVS